MRILANDAELTPLFALDLAQTREAQGEAVWTEYPLESGAAASDSAHLAPVRYTVAGLLTACTDDVGVDEARPSALVDALRALVDARELVWLATDSFVALVALDSWRASDGEDAFTAVEITAHTVQQTRYEYTTIPPELLAPEVKAGSATAQGTADSAKEMDEPTQRKSLAAKLADNDFGDWL